MTKKTYLTLMDRLGYSRDFTSYVHYMENSLEWANEAEVIKIAKKYKREYQWPPTAKCSN